EHQSANEYVSYYDWEIAITEYEGEKAARQFTIPNDVLADLAPTTVRTLYHAELPFELQISGFAPNAAPRLAPQDQGAVDGVIIERLKLDTNAEANIAGAYGLVAPKSGEPMKGILWGGAIAPWLVTVGGKDYALDLRHTRTEVPFTIRLDKFIRELHPRTGIASNFESEVTKTEGEISRQVDIKMNEPLRHRGYTFFQASWGPENAGPNDKLFSVFSVVRNPADQWPLYACLIISGGLLVHFLQKLFRYLRAENRRHA
ncbi:MAG: cytochrome c biogenesis protein ResB, partial [Candidatus Hydrogenedentes bacterium]|nr:cytochrome c biogenesis protein ResB [Candidatus Hydrogenedentota bacterium]